MRISKGLLQCLSHANNMNKSTGAPFQMKRIQILLFATGLIFVMAAFGKNNTSAGRAVDLKASDGAILKATYFAAPKPGPGVLLFHQSNRTRKSWDDVAEQLAAAGINTLTLDVRGHGETGGREG